MDDQHIAHHKDKIYATIAVVALVVMVISFLFLYTKNKYNRIDNLHNPIVKTVAPIVREDPFKKITLSAKAAVVWDVKNKKFIYKKNEQDILPLASLTKLMTIVSAVSLLPNQSTVKITNNVSVDGDKDPVLLNNEVWKAKDLISLTLVSSSNVGASAIASVAGAFLPKTETTDPDTLFINYINSQVKKLGMKSTTFYNDNGLDLNLKKGGAYGDAKDMVILMDYILRKHPEILESTTHSQLTLISPDNVVHTIKNTNPTIEDIPGVLGSKTGYTDLAQGNLIIAFSPGLEGPYIAVVLGSTYSGRFTDMNTLVNATLQKLAE